MNTYDFIFSHQLRYRIPRHVLFWLIWYVFMLLTYQFPAIHFPNWIINDLSPVEKEGGWIDFIFYCIILYSRALLIAMAFTYAVVYFALPRVIHKKNGVITTAACIFIVAAAIVAQYFTNLQTGNILSKRGALPATSSYAMAHSLKIFFFNYPTAAGLAVAIKLLRRWWLKQREIEQVAKEKASAELQLLKAQIHPHFLFNSLNNIYSFALEGSPKAPEMIQKLKGLVHYMLYECKQPVVALEKELKMIQDYIELEKVRYGERLKIEVQLPQDNHTPLIAPLLLIPFVENSFKHGTSKMLAHPYVTLTLTLHNNVLYFRMTNSKPMEAEAITINNNRGLGLNNVRKRLTLLYPNHHVLQILDEPASYTAWLKIDLTPSASEKIKALKKEEPEYALE